MGKQQSTPAQDQNGVTLMVFKDNFAARTFRIPLAWISQFGFFVGILAAATALSTILAVRFYRTASRANPVRVIDLEQEISELKATNKTLESKIGANSLTPVATTGPAEKPEAKEPPPPPQTAPTSGANVLFSAFPANVVDASAQAAQLPITVSPAKTKWRGKILDVDFNIQYTGTDKGSQQGRIILIARGTDTLLAYPETVLNRAGSASLIAPEQGEYFSVSRFREVHAEFGPVRAQSALKDVEIMILSKEGRMIFYQKIVPSAAPPAPAKPAPVSAPKAAAPAKDTAAKDSEETIEPGVDQ